MVLMKERKGFFIVIDGIDGSGKSTQIKLIKEYFTKHKRDFIVTREPSKGNVGKLLRKYLKKPESPPALDALLFAADRIDHCTTEIIPNLQQGKIVISDRYRDSSYIYQTVQQDLKLNEKKSDSLQKIKNQFIPEIDMDWIKQINNHSIAPNITFILDIDPEKALKRRLTHNQENEEETEKFEFLEFQKRIRKMFLEIVDEKKDVEEDRHILINADQNPEGIFNEIKLQLKKRIQSAYLMK